MRSFREWGSVCLAVAAIACGSTRNPDEPKRCPDPGCPANGGSTPTSSGGKTSAGSGGTPTSAGGAGAGGAGNGTGGVTSGVDTDGGDSTPSGGATGSGGAAGGRTGSGGATGSSGTRPLSTGGSGGGCELPDAGPAGPWDPASHLDTNGILMPPAAADGFQLASPLVDLDPGQESYRCAHVAAPVTAEFDVGEWESQLPSGVVESTVFRTSGDSAPEGTLDGTSCTLGFGANLWLYSAAAPRAHLAFPPGVGMSLSARQRLLLDLHFVNAGIDRLQAKILVNATRARTECGFQEAQAQVSFNTTINIPLNGTQTVTGNCRPAVGAKYFYMTTLTRRRGTDANIIRNQAGGTPVETLLDSTSWQAPQIRTWEPPDFLVFAPGESYSYNCSYRNDRNAATTVGTSAETNEVCQTFAYFFPASASAPTCN